MGNPELRSLLVLGATSVLRHARGNPNASEWITAILARRPYKIVAVALANKMARIIWALLRRAVHIGIWKQQPASRRPDRYADPNDTDRRRSRQRQVHRQTMISLGRNPEARQAVFRTALTARKCDQPLASRTSSRPAVLAALIGRTYDRTVPA